MVSFLRKILGKSRIRVHGLNQNRHIKSLCDKGVICFDITKRYFNEIDFSVYSSDLHYVKQEFDGNYEVIRQTGLINLYNHFKKNLIIILSFFIFFMSFPFLNLFVWQVKIYANQDTTAQVELFLKNNKIDAGRLKKQYALHSIQNELQQSLPALFFCDVFIKGETLIINIKEKTTDATINFDLNPLICEYDAIVEHIDVISGTAKVKKGDIIEAGEILVEPYIIRQGVFRKCEVVANVKVRCFHKEKLIFKENDEIYVRTGRKIVKNNFTIFKDFDKLKLDRIKFSSFECVTNCKNQRVFPIVPLRLTSITIYELKKQSIIRSFVDYKQELETKMKNDTLDKIDAGQLITYAIDSKLVEEGIYEITFSVDFIKSIIKE